MQISTSTTENGVVQLQIRGELDANTARELDQVLNDLLDLGHSRLVLDASQMGYISSAGLRVVLFAHLKACQLGGEMRVFGLSAQVYRILEIAGFDELFQIKNTYDEAIKGW